MVQDSQKLFPELIELAVLQLKERKLKWRMSVRMDLKRFLVPTLGALRARVPSPNQSSQRNSSLNMSTSTAGPSTTTYRVDTAYYGIDPNEVIIHERDTSCPNNFQTNYFLRSAYGIFNQIYLFHSYSTNYYRFFYSSSILTMSHFIPLHFTLLPFTSLRFTLHYFTSLTSNLIQFYSINFILDVSHTTLDGYHLFLFFWLT